MKLPLPVATMIIGLIGIVIGVLITLRSLKNKAKLYNEPFDYKQALADDWFVPAINLMLIFVLWIGLPYRSGAIANYSDLYVLGVFLAVGIMGTVFLSSGLSVVKKRFEKAVDYKTDVADGISDKTDKTDKPTP